MNYPKPYFRIATYCISLLASVAGVSAQGTFQRISAEFTGSARENWESFSRANVSGLSGVPLAIFGGAATIIGPNEYIWISQIGVADPNTGGFGLGPYAARSHDGSQGYGTSLSFGTSSIVFNTSIGQFGGYWGSASTTQPITFTFYDAQGSAFARDTVVYSAPNNNGTLEWFGWRSDMPISRVDYSGAWVVNDSLRFTAVPEPASALLFFAGGNLLLALRRSRLVGRSFRALQRTAAPLGR
jgi:hypothetical protein